MAGTDDGRDADCLAPFDRRHADDGVANTATVSSSTPDPDADDNTATASSDVTPAADLSLGKAITSGVPVAGSPIRFLLQVDNLGPSDATGVVVTDSVPTAVRDLAAVPDQGTCTVSAQLLTWAWGRPAREPPSW